MIPVNEPVVGQEEIANVTECLRTGWISSAGKFIEQFERDWANQCGARYGIAVCNGTAALQIAVESLQLKPGDEVILPTFTIISCALAVIKVGAVPVLVDSEHRTWGMNVADVAGLITSRTRAILPVHIYGHPVDMDPLLDLARRHNLKVVEDAAEVHGAEYLSGRTERSQHWVKCGGMGDMGAFSFYANKLITTGEGGMVVTNDPKLAERLRSLRNLCFRPPRRFYHTELGYNFRMTNLQAAIGVAQISRLSSIVDRKRSIAARYNNRLSKLSCIQLPSEESWARSVYWVYGIVLDDQVPLDAKDFGTKLYERGIETRPFFLGLHEQPALHSLGHYLDSVGRFPVAERIARRGLYLPSGLAITDSQIDEVCTEVERILGE